MKALPRSAIEQAKNVAREPYAWPGGYPRFLVMDDGGCLCPACVKSEFRLIAGASKQFGDANGWKAVGSDINWEDPALHCANCGNLIPSAYAEGQS